MKIMTRKMQGSQFSMFCVPVPKFTVFLHVDLMIRQGMWGQFGSSHRQDPTDSPPCKVMLAMSTNAQHQHASSARIISTHSECMNAEAHPDCFRCVYATNSRDVVLQKFMYLLFFTLHISRVYAQRDLSAVFPSAHFLCARAKFIYAFPVWQTTTETRRV